MNIEELKQAHIKIKQEHDYFYKNYTYDWEKEVVYPTIIKLADKTQGKIIQSKLDNKIKHETESIKLVKQFYDESEIIKNNKDYSSRTIEKLCYDLRQKSVPTLKRLASERLLIDSDLYDSVIDFVTEIEETLLTEYPMMGNHDLVSLGTHHEYGLIGLGQKLKYVESEQYVYTPIGLENLELEILPRIGDNLIPLSKRDFFYYNSKGLDIQYQDAIHKYRKEHNLLGDKSWERVKWEHENKGIGEIEFLAKIFEDYYEKFEEDVKIQQRAQAIVDRERKEIKEAALKKEKKPTVSEQIKSIFRKG